MSRWLVSGTVSSIIVPTSSSHAEVASNTASKYVDQGVGSARSADRRVLSLGETDRRRGVVEARALRDGRRKAVGWLRIAVVIARS